MKKTMQWKIHIPNLLQEIMNNSGSEVLRIPLNMLRLLLQNVAVRASQLNDKKLNQLMLQMTLYEVADPTSKSYSRKILKQYSLQKREKVDVEK